MSTTLQRKTLVNKARKFRLGNSSLHLMSLIFKLIFAFIYLIIPIIRCYSMLGQVAFTIFRIAVLPSVVIAVRASRIHPSLPEMVFSGTVFWAPASNAPFFCPKWRTPLPRRGRCQKDFRCTHRSGDDDNSTFSSPFCLTRSPGWWALLFSKGLTSWDFDE